MLYTSITELPFFETYRTDRTLDLVGELEMQNNETKGNVSIFDSKNEIQIKNIQINQDSKGSSCKC